MSTTYHYLDQTDQKFYYLNRHNFISYTFADSSIITTGRFTVVPQFSLTDMNNMLHHFVASLIIAYPAVNYVSSYPGTKSIPLAKTLVSAAEPLASHFYGDNTAYVLYSDRLPVSDAVSFRQTILSLPNDNSDSAWRCNQKHNNLNTIALTVAVRPNVPIIPLVSYYILDEDGYFISEQDNLPSSTVNYYAAMDLRQIFQTRRIRVDENNKLHFEIKSTSN